MPERLNIGLIIGDGSTVSFLGEPCALSGILDTLEKSSVYMRTVQVREPERAPGIFKEYGLDGCIWYLPGNSLFPRIRKALMETGVPVVAMMLYEYSQAEAEHLPNFRVEPDFQGIGRLRAEFMLGRGHRKIACFTKPESEVYKGFISAIAGAGAVHSPDWAIRSGEIFEKIPRLLDEGEATAMIVNGGSTEMEKVFQALEGHPRGGDIELLVDYCGHMLPGMIARHPKLRVVAVNHYPGRELGMEAAKALLGNIQGGLPPAPLKLISQIRKPDGTSFN